MQIAELLRLFRYNALVRGEKGGWGLAVMYEVAVNKVLEGLDLELSFLGHHPR